ncbi:hypothetical protein ABG768_003710, partial [Culter alburnus]
CAISEQPERPDRSLHGEQTQRHEPRRGHLSAHREGYFEPIHGSNETPAHGCT